MMQKEIRSSYLLLLSQSAHFVEFIANFLCVQGEVLAFECWWLQGEVETKDESKNQR